MTQQIFSKLDALEERLNEQTILKKEVLNFDEACRYMDLSKSHLYKLTSQRMIPHYCPHGKKLYFKRVELDQWLLQNRKASQDELDRQAANHLIKKGGNQ